MTNRQCSTAGWLAIWAAVLAPGLLVLGLLTDINLRRGTTLWSLLAVQLVLGLVQAALSLYALHRLRTLLNERHAFHGVDGLVPWIIAGAALIVAVSSVGRIVQYALPGNPTLTMSFAAAIVPIGLFLSVLSVVFGYRLLRIGDNLYGLLKPYAWLSILQGAVSATVILLPVGLMLGSVGTLLLGLMFLRAGEGEAVPEFV